MKRLFNVFTILLVMIVSYFSFFDKDNIIADAQVSTDTTSYVEVGEIWDSVNLSFNDLTVNELMTYITGDVNYDVEDVYSHAMKTMTSTDMRNVVVDESALVEGDYSTKSNSQDIVVMFGNYNWTPTYLSLDKNNNVILTLWMTNSSVNCYYNTWKSSNQFSDLSSGVNQNNCYGTSYIRAVGLNNGGIYANSETSLTTATQSATHWLKDFTVNEDLTKFLVTPADVEWQQKEQKTTQNGLVMLNDNYSINTDDYFGLASHESYLNVEYYDNWKNDYLWLPSCAEVSPNDDLYSSLWQTSIEQRMSGSITHLRSAFFLFSSYMIQVMGNGNLSTDELGNKYYTANNSFSVRPALHLNLTEVLENISSNKNIVDINEGNYFSVYDGNVKDITVCYIGSVARASYVDITDECELTYICDNRIVSEIKEVGKYIVLINPGEEFNNETWTFIYEVKPIDVSNDLIVNVLSSHTYNGEQQNPTLEVKYGDDVWTEGVEYKKGLESVTSAGKTRVKVIPQGIYGGYKIVEFDVAKADIANATITGIEDSYVYTGSEIITEDIMVTLYDTSLFYYSSGEPETSFCNVEYLNNTNVGTATIVITAKDNIMNFTGSITRTFEITPCDITGGEITLDNDSFYYTGNYITPAIKSLVTSSSNGTLEVPVDMYDVTYSSNKELGVATVTVQGKGNFKGSVSKTFEITQNIFAEDVGIVVDDECYTKEFSTNYSRSGLNFDIEVYDILGNIIDSSNYEVEYTRNGESTLDFSNAGTIDINVVPVGDNYSGFSRGTININKINIIDCTNRVFPPVSVPYQYTGKPINPIKDDGCIFIFEDCILLDGEEILCQGYNNVNVTGNLAYIYYEGIGNFTGTISFDFYIEAVEISNTTIQVSDNYYTGSEVGPILNIEYNGQTLTQGVDYYWAIDDFVSKAYDGVLAYIYGINNFTGRKEIVFNILPADIDAVEVELNQTMFDYTRQEIKPTIKSIIFNDLNLEEGVDYEISYFNNINAGIGKVVLTGLNNFTGTKEIEFVIQPLIITDENLIDFVDLVMFDEKCNQYAPELNIKNGDYVLSRSYEINFDMNLYDYNVTMLENDQYSTYTITTGKKQLVFNFSSNYVNQINGNYYFYVSAGDLKDANIVLGVNNLIYNHEIQTPEIQVELNNSILDDGVHYSVEYRVGSIDGEIVMPINVGKYYLIIKALSDDDKFYIGQNYAMFNIVQEDIVNVSVYNLQDNHVFTGQEIEPLFDLQNHNHTLTRDDYSFEYSNNLNVGLAKIIIQGKGNYTGEKIVTFNIVEGQFDDVLLIRIDDVISKDGEISIIFKGVNINPNIEVRDVFGSVVSSDDYIIKYYRSESETNDLLSVGTIVVKVYPTINNSTNSTNYKGVCVGEIQILPKAIESNEINIEVESTHTFNYQDQIPNFKLLLGDYVLTETDYDYSLSENINAGNGQINIIAKDVGNFSGTTVKLFKINAQDINNVEVFGVNPEYEWSGQIIKPNISLTFNGVKLEEKDYLITYYNNLDVGTASLSIEGNGNFDNVRTITFEIIKKTPEVDVYLPNGEYYENDTSPVLNHTSLVAGVAYVTDEFLEFGKSEYEYVFVPYDEIHYNKVYGTIEINVLKLIIENIEIIGDYKKDYIAYETFDSRGIVVCATYNNGSSKSISSYTISKIDGDEILINDEVAISIDDTDIIEVLDIEILPRKLNIEFSNYSNLLDNKKHQKINVSILGEVENRSSNPQIIYKNLDTGNTVEDINSYGNYRVTVIFSNNNYINSGDNLIDFYVKQVVLNNNDGALEITNQNGFEKGVVLSAEKLISKKEVSIEDIDIKGRFKYAYDIEFVKNSQGVDISNNIQVKVLLENIKNKNMLKLYSLSSSGELTELDYVVDGDFAIISNFNGQKLIVSETGNITLVFIIVLCIIVALIVIVLALYYFITIKKQQTIKRLDSIYIHNYVTKNNDKR